MALGLVLALCIATIPVLGVTSWLCFTAALAFRLNMAAMQAVNWLATPLQLFLLVPFLHAGATLFGMQPLATLPAELFASLREDPSNWLGAVWRHLLAATAVWLGFTVLALVVLVPPLRLILIRLLDSRLFAASVKRQATAPSLGDAS